MIFPRLAIVALVSSALGFACCGGSQAPHALADQPSTPTLTPTPTIVVATEPTSTTVPTSTPVPTATATPHPQPTREVQKHPSTKPAGTSPSKAEATPTPTPKPGSKPRTKSRRHTKRKHAERKPTRTPVLTLNAEDSISPVTCTGSAKPNAKHPFLLPPYQGWTSLSSYFDHDLPDFSQDGLIVTANGMMGQPDSTHQGNGFPAYWDASIRQFLYYDGHNGYDYNLTYQPVYSAAAGKVIFSRYEYPDARDHGYGQMIMIEHSGGYVTLYGHLSKLLVKKQAKVKAGQEIAISGNTGHSTGPHLHFTVFHNCSPTDPYGWTGSGPDPLAQYKGESSIYLWKSQPLITNPAPAWPEIDKLPGTTDERILLLQLPPVSKGTAKFTSELLSEAESVQANLSGVNTKLDLLRGAVDVRGRVKPSSIYSLLDVASISTPDTIEGAKQDVLQTLARASLYDKVRRFPVFDVRGWTGFLLRWQGRALLLGKGVKGQDVSLRLQGHGGAWHRVEADPATGAYALDLGRLTTKQLNSLKQDLTSSSKTRTHVSVRTSPARGATSLPPVGSGSSSFPYWEVGVAVALLLLASGAVTWRLGLLPGQAGSEEPPASGG